MSQLSCWPGKIDLTRRFESEPNSNFSDMGLEISGSGRIRVLDMGSGGIRVNPHDPKFLLGSDLLAANQIEFGWDQIQIDQNNSMFFYLISYIYVQKF